MLHSLGYEVWGEMDKELEKIINIISMCVAFENQSHLKHSTCQLGRNLIVYIYRQLTVCFLDDKEVNSHISLACNAIISSYIAVFHSGSNIASR